MPTPIEYRLEVVSRTGVSQADTLKNAVLKKARWELNNPGSISYTMNQNDPQVVAPLMHKNEVQLWVNNSLMHWAFHRSTKNNPRTVDFECPGLLEYFNARFILNATQTYTSIEQMQIAGAVVQAAQTPVARDWGIVLGSYTPSGVIRSREYKRDEHKNVLEILQEFQTVADAAGNPTGFDIDVIFDGTGLRQFKMYYPRRGTTRSNLLMEYGVNVTDYGTTEDAGDMANRVYATGGANGDIKFENNATNSASVAEFGQWEDIVSISGENDVNMLLQRAQKETSERGTVKKDVTLTAIEVPDRLLLGVVQPGDTLPVSIHNGRDQFEGNYRIKAVEWLPGPGNMKLEFV